MMKMMKKYILLLIVIFSFSGFPLKSVQAGCVCVACPCVAAIAFHVSTQATLIAFIGDAMYDLVDEYINGTLVEELWWPALQAMAEQITVSNAETMGKMASTISDVGQQYHKQLKIQSAKAKAMVASLPDEGTCETITASAGIISSDSKSKALDEVLAQNGKERTQGKVGKSGARGPGYDLLDRFEFASRHYFTKNEWGGALVDYAIGTDDTRFGADISSSTLFKPTLNIDFTDNITTADEEDIMALKMNLYQDTVLTRIAPRDLADYGGLNEFDDINEFTAWQALAEWSFDSIVSLKAEGADVSGVYIREILKELGHSDADIEHKIGENLKPSYLQQLEILSKTMQSGTATHVKNIVGETEAMRKLAIKEAIELMVKFEIYKSLQRSTILTTTLHESYRQDFQDKFDAHPMFTNDSQIEQGP